MLGSILQASVIRKEWPLWTLFFITQLGVLINLVIRPELPVVFLIAFAILTLVASLLNRKVLLVLVTLAVFTSESLYVEVGNAVVRLIDVVLMWAILALFLRWSLQTDSRIEPLPKFKVALGVLIGVGLLSLLGTVSMSNSLLEMTQIVELVIAAVVFFNFLKDESDIHLVFATILIYGIVDAAWIFANYLLGDLHGRHIGIFQTLANELNYGVAIAVAFYHIVRKRALRLAILLGGAFQLATIFISKGRGLLITALLMAFVCAFLFAIREQRWRSFVFVTTVLVLTFLISFFGISADIQSRFASVVEGGEMRDLRLIMWAVALKIWQNHPIFGVGVGNIELAAVQFIPKTFGIVATALGYRLGSPHNEYLSFAVQGGWIGFVGGILFYAILVWNALIVYLKRRANIENYSIIVLSFVLGLVVYTLANDALLAGKGMLVMLFMALIARLQALDGRTPA